MGMAALMGRIIFTYTLSQRLVSIAAPRGMDMAALIPQMDITCMAMEGNTAYTVEATPQAQVVLMAQMATTRGNYE